VEHGSGSFGVHIRSKGFGTGLQVGSQRKRLFQRLSEEIEVINERSQFCSVIKQEIGYICSKSMSKLLDMGKYCSEAPESN
jgi:hypothetical protein